jgi:hypothetical protein
MAEYLVLTWTTLNDLPDESVVKAASLEELTAQIKADVIRDYHANSTCYVQEVMVAQYPIHLPVSQWISQEKQKQEQKDREELEKKERAELARLQKKYKIAPPPGRK